MKIKNKKAVSQVVSYVLLIVVVISLSTLVFTFLLNFIPEEKVTCSEGLSLVVKDFECYDNGQVKIEFQNKGTFKIDGVYIRGSNTSQGVSVNFLNATYNETYNVTLITKQNKGFLYFGRRDFPLPLAPTRNYAQIFNYSEYGILTQVQIQPFLNDKETNELTLCTEKTITQDIACP